MSLKKDTHLSTIFIPVLTFVLFIISWKIIIFLFNISPLILPSPFLILKVLMKNIGNLLQNALITFFEAFVGFLLGLIIAILLASLFQFSKLAEKAIYPYVITLRAVPLIALAPLIVIWSGTGYLSKIILAAIISLFPILVNMIKGLNSVDPDAVDMLKTFSATKWQIFKKVRLPSSLPYLFAGMKISSSFAVIGAIVAEFTGANNGIGYIIKSSSYYSQTDLTFAGIIVASIIGLLFFGIIILLEKYMLFWQKNEQ